MNPTSFIFTVLILFTFGRLSTGLRQLRQESSILIDAGNVNELPALLRAASPGTSFLIDVAKITLSETLYFNVADISFMGLQSRDRPIITCNGNRSANLRIVVDAPRVQLRNIVIEDCRGPALQVTNSEVVFGSPLVGAPYALTISNVTFSNNMQLRRNYQSYSDGGALQINSGTKVTVRNCEFIKNYGVVGGAISLLGSASLRVFDSLFSENTATLSGAGIYGGAAPDVPRLSSKLQVTRCTFIRNEDETGFTDSTGLTLAEGIPLEANAILSFPVPQSSAGAIFARNFKSVVIKNCSFQNNTAATAGGAVFIADNNKVSISKSTFSGNVATEATRAGSRPALAQGGALYIAFVEDRSQVEIQDCTFHKNSASYGSGIHLVGTLTTKASISSCEFRQNVASLGGGGLLIRNIVQVELVDVQFVQNSARLGGGLLVTNGAGVRFLEGPDALRNVLFSENEAVTGGGCCFLAAGTVVGQEVTFNLNHALRNGGAVAMIEGAFGSSIGFQDSTFSNNSARLGGAIYQDSSATFYLLRTRRGLSFLSGNRAVSGGALYLQPWSQVRNNIQITGTVITQNEAVLSSEELPQLTRPLPDVNLSSIRDSSFFVDNEVQSFTCSPGGGGGVCLSLIPLLPRASLRIAFDRTNIVQNKAIIGGGVLISGSMTSNCIDSCPVEGDNIPTSSTLCSGLQFDQVYFTENEATDNGSTILLEENGTAQWTCPSA
eukprot:g7019.t1